VDTTKGLELSTQNAVTEFLPQDEVVILSIFVYFLSMKGNSEYLLFE
jgi:hypothetical protein